MYLVFYKIIADYEGLNKIITSYVGLSTIITGYGELSKIIADYGGLNKIKTSVSIIRQDIMTKEKNVWRDSTKSIMVKKRVLTVHMSGEIPIETVGNQLIDKQPKKNLNQI